MNTLLLEIGLEEMPAQMILPAIEQLSEKAKQTFEQNHLHFDNLQLYSTPRRLAILFEGLPDKQDDQNLEIKGPPLQISKDENGEWSKAAQGFAKKNQIDLSDLYTQDFQGKEFVFAKKAILGQTTNKVIQNNIIDWITGLSFPKNMRWGNYKLKYIRPIRWVTALWNDQLLPFKLEMTESSRQLHGHRFLNPESIDLKHASEYPTQLELLHVIADYQKRQDLIVKQVKDLEGQHHFNVILEEELLREVTNLVEWPTVLIGSFEKDFLKLPPDVLVITMAKHQRYFPVYDANQKLLPHFITVRNGDSHCSDVVVQGNEKVIRARLSDAQFFFLEDQKHELAFFNEQAKNVVFFKDRGSLMQRIERIETLSVWIAEQLQLNSQQKETVHRIATLCKFDLQTQMVYEFAELQGIMGEQYAQLKGESELVSRGIREHYHPRTMQDSIPQNIETIAVALADKLDMLATAFSLNIIPTGSADPYALRRMSQGVVQIILEAQMLLSIHDLNVQALKILDQQQNLGLDILQITSKLSEFFELRERFFMQEANIRYDVIEALINGNKLLPLQQSQLGVALDKHLETPMFKRAVEAIVRAANITKKHEGAITEKIVESSLVSSEEKELLKLVQALKQSPVNWDNYCQTLFDLEPTITAFFDKVLVMDEDPIKQNNRLSLCQSIADWSWQYMDLNKIVFSK